jgi:hypothetical protein
VLSNSPFYIFNLSKGVKKMKNLLLILLFSVFASSASAAIFDGQTLQYQYYFSDLSSPYSNASNGNYVVGGGVEIANIVDGSGTLDLQGDRFVANITDTSWFNTGAFNGFRITDINGTIADFTSFTFGSNTSLSGAPVLTWDANNLWANFSGLTFVPGQFELVVTAAVPEPETYAMLLVGLGLIGFMARRRNNFSV